MKALLNQTVTVVFVAFALAQTGKTAQITSNAGYADRHSLNRYSQKTIAQSGVAEQAKPTPAPKRWLGLIGEYGTDTGILYILEKDGRLCALFRGAEIESLEERAKNIFRFSEQGPHAGKRLVFTRDAKGRATQVEVDGIVCKRRQIEPEGGAAQLLIKPVRPVSELLKEALAPTSKPTSLLDR